MKRIFLLLLLVISISTYGQRNSISYRPDILTTKDPSILAVKQLWESYLTNSKTGFDKPSLDYWNKQESDQGFGDIAKAAIALPDFVGEIQVYDIKLTNDNFYIIRNIWTLSYNNNKMMLGIFNVYAKKTNSGFKLFNCLYCTKPQLKNYKYKNFNFYYPYNYSFNAQKASQAVEFYLKISQEYGNKYKPEITYIIGNNLDEAWRFIGFDYSPISSSSLFAGKQIISQNIILTCREDHVHEMIHNIFNPMFPNCPALFGEGIAAYYGGSGGEKYSDLLLQLKQTITEKTNVDLSNFVHLDSLLDNGKINNYYTLGAIFIDYAIKNGGVKKVLALLQCKDPNPDDFSDDIEDVVKVLDIPGDQINRFLRNYIINYKLN